MHSSEKNPTNISTRYFQKRLKKIASNDQKMLAARELETLRILERLSDVRFLFQGAHVADLGCGDQFLRPEFEALGMKYNGYDIEDLDIEHDPLPLADNSQDLIVNFAMLEHLKCPENMLQESMRCLKKGGCLLINTPNWKYSSDIFFDDYTHVKPYSPLSLRAMLADFGFSGICDYPNMRCKSDRAYTNKNRYFWANLRPFSGKPRFSKLIPEFLKGKAKGMFFVAKKL